MNKKILTVITTIAIFLIGIGLFFSINNFSKKDIPKNDINEEFTKFVSKEFNYSLEYPCNWWHNSVPTENLGNDPLSSVILLSSDEFGMGNYPDYQHSYSNDSTMFNFNISVYNVAEGHTIEDAKTEFGLYNIGNTSEKINNYNAIVKIRDDSNHEIESMRIYIKNYYIQNKNNFYEISFVVLNESILDQNSNNIDNILSSFIIGDNVKKNNINQEVQENKQVQIPSVFSEIIEFEIPSDWNAAYNGDPIFVTDLSNFGGSQSMIASVSSSDYPVTHSDINWEQVDFYLVDGDLVTSLFIERQKQSTEEQVEDFQSNLFTGIVSTDLLESDVPNKGDTGGSTYYLRPKLESPKWNLIIVVQSKGDDQFESGVEMILNSISYE